MNIPKKICSRLFVNLFWGHPIPIGESDPPLIENLHRAIEANESVDFSKWSPVLGISSNGAIVLNWERLNPKEE